MCDNIAVIMSIYKNDRLDFVSQAVESILYQTYYNFDFYIQYDGPVKNEIESYFVGLNDNRIKIYKRSENKGLAQSLNDLLNIVMPLEYEYIARMDADDICDTCRFERQIEYLQEHPDIECLGTFAVEINSKGEEYYRKQMPVSHEECKELFRKRDCMIHPTVMYRRSYIEKAGLYSLDTYFGEDTMK